VKTRRERGETTVQGSETSPRRKHPKSRTEQKERKIRKLYMGTGSGGKKNRGEGGTLSPARLTVTE